MNTFIAFYCIPGTLYNFPYILPPLDLATCGSCLKPVLTARVRSFHFLHFFACGVNVVNKRTTGPALLFQTVTADRKLRFFRKCCSFSASLLWHHGVFRSSSRRVFSWILYAIFLSSLSWHFTYVGAKGGNRLNDLRLPKGLSVSANPLAPAVPTPANSSTPGATQTIGSSGGYGRVCTTCTGNLFISLL